MLQFWKWVKWTGQLSTCFVQRHQTVPNWKCKRKPSFPNCRLSANKIFLCYFFFLNIFIKFTIVKLIQKVNVP